jgi:membrane fusion protein, multidrug efflux system
MADDQESRDNQHEGVNAEKPPEERERPAHRHGPVEQPEQPGPGEQGELGKSPERKSRLKRVLGNRKVQVTLALIMIISALLIWWYYSFWESTDDAQIDGHIMQISARISGHVSKVRFEDNQFAKAGTILVEIDPTDYQVAYDRAKAAQAEAAAAAEAARAGVPITSIGTSSQVATARARVENARAGILGAQKELEAARARHAEAKANSAKYQSDLRRYTPLVLHDVISRQQYDQVVAAAKVAAAGVEAADASARAARQQVAQARGELAQMEANLRSARTGPQQVTVARSRSVSAEAALKNAGAMVEQARLNLGYTRVAAPVDGITGKKGVEIGQNVQPGQVLLYLVPVEDVWVTANFKENQLRKIRPGQHVTISVDAYHREYDGYVESIGAASGARFSLFPPENATGNYIKVVQRIPVRIRFSRGQDAKHLLRPGMSVVPKVRVK